MDAVRLTGLWKARDKNGNIYLGGFINAISRVLVMPNTFKKNNEEPDYFLYLRPNSEHSKQDKHQKGVLNYGNGV